MTNKNNSFCIGKKQKRIFNLHTVTNPYSSRDSVNYHSVYCCQEIYSYSITQIFLSLSLSRLTHYLPVYNKKQDPLDC